MAEITAAQVDAWLADSDQVRVTRERLYQLETENAQLRQQLAELDEPAARMRRRLLGDG